MFGVCGKHYQITRTNTAPITNSRQSSYLWKITKIVIPKIHFCPTPIIMDMLKVRVATAYISFIYIFRIKG